MITKDMESILYRGNIFDCFCYSFFSTVCDTHNEGYMLK